MIVQHFCAHSHIPPPNQPQGNKRNIVENRNMWGTFTAETFTPFLEFDFLGADVWETMLGKSK